MKLTTKGRYGLRLMLDLASHEGQGAILLKDIAQRQNLSEKYLWSLISPLKTAGFVRSIRGAKGGYMLAKPPGEITLKDVVTTLEGPLCLVDCVCDDNYCNRHEFCMSHNVWKTLSEQLTSMFENITLASILEDFEKQTGQDIT